MAKELSIPCDLKYKRDLTAVKTTKGGPVKRGKSLLQVGTRPIERVVFFMAEENTQDVHYGAGR
ncbi:MAG: hypothetical protein D6690_12005 [Nitrospirae bacterium]|nr:MAG: hypothetical protein D6690_12005 [Nitrospirota bacterium]